MKTNKMSIAALVLSVFPFITLLLTFLGVTLSDNLRTPMAMTNCICTFAAFILAVFLVKNKEKRNVPAILALIISGLLLLVIVGILIFALLYNAAN